MKTFLLATAAVLTLSGGSTFAQSANGLGGSSSSGALGGGVPALPFAGQSVPTGQGQVFTTGRVGGLATTTLPGGAGQGLLMNNGNGTSTLTGPGGVPTTVPTP